MTTGDALSVGDVIVDNDPRMAPRRLTIVEILPDRVDARDAGGRVFTYPRHRIYTDGRQRRNGFSLERNP